MPAVKVEIVQSSTKVDVTQTSVDVDITQTSTNVALGNSGPQGTPGDTGPANSLSIGTVTTGAAGSSASATITGTAPSQTLSLTIPRGDTGNSGIALTSGYYYAPEGSTLSRSFSLNYVYFVPFIFPAATDISRLGVVLIATALSNTVRLGVYDNTADNKPGDLLVATSAFQTGTGQTLGFKSSEAELSVQQGLYWLAFVNQGSVPSTFLANNQKPYFIPQGTIASPVTNVATQYQHWNQASVTGDFPATATPVLFDTSVQPRIFIGVS